MVLPACRMAVLSAPADVIASRKRLSGFYLRPAVFAVEMDGTEFSDQYARERTSLGVY